MKSKKPSKNLKSRFFENPFKHKDFKNPGKTLEESEKRIKRKERKIKELMQNTDFEAQRKDETLKHFQEKEIIGREYFNFSIENMEEAMKGKPEKMPKFDSIEQLDEWLERGSENE